MIEECSFIDDTIFGAKRRLDHLFVRAANNQVLLHFSISSHLILLGTRATFVDDEKERVQRGDDKPGVRIDGSQDCKYPLFFAGVRDSLLRFGSTH